MSANKILARCGLTRSEVVRIVNSQKFGKFIGDAGPVDAFIDVSSGDGEDVVDPPSDDGAGCPTERNDLPFDLSFLVSR